MTTIMPEVHDALARAVATRPAPRHRRRPSWRTGLLVFGAVVVCGSAVAATTGWRPSLGTARHGRPLVAHAAIPTAQGAALGVLRRPQDAGDRGAATRAVLRLLIREEINGVHTDGIRVLRRRTDGVTLLMPVERIGRHDAGYPSTVRRQVLCLFTSIRIAVGAHAAPRGLVAGASCGDLRRLRSGEIGTGERARSGFILNGLVPDGVARVTMRFNGSRTIAAAVRDNLWEVRIGKGIPLGLKVRWFDTHGRLIRH
jgi:hypothetical protein